MVGIQEHGMHIRRKTCIEVRTFQRILKDTNKPESSLEHKLLKVSFVMIFY